MCQFQFHIPDLLPELPSVVIIEDTQPHDVLRMSRDLECLPPVRMMVIVDDFRASEIEQLRCFWLPLPLFLLLLPLPFLALLWTNGWIVLGGRSSLLLSSLDRIMHVDIEDRIRLAEDVLLQQSSVAIHRGRQGTTNE